MVLQMTNFKHYRFQFVGLVDFGDKITLFRFLGVQFFSELQYFRRLRNENIIIAFVKCEVYLPISKPTFISPIIRGNKYEEHPSALSP